MKQASPGGRDGEEPTAGATDREDFPSAREARHPGDPKDQARGRPSGSRPAAWRPLRFRDAVRYATPSRLGPPAAAG